MIVSIDYARELRSLKDESFEVERHAVRVTIPPPPRRRRIPRLLGLTIVYAILVSVAAATVHDWFPQVPLGRPLSLDDPVLVGLFKLFVLMAIAHLTLALVRLVWFEGAPTTLDFRDRVISITGPSAGWRRQFDLDANKIDEFRFVRVGQWFSTQLAYQLWVAGNDRRMKIWLKDEAFAQQVEDAFRAALGMKLLKH
jgi:hypothetical protein